MKSVRTTSEERSKGKEVREGGEKYFKYRAKFAYLYNICGEGRRKIPKKRKKKERD